MNLSTIASLTHQNFIIRPSILEIRSSGSLMHAIVYVGIPLTIAFKRTSLLDCDKSFSFHSCNFLKILSFISSKLAFFRHSTKDGSPKYFSKCLISWTPDKSLISCFASTIVRLLKKRFVFPRGGNLCSRVGFVSC